jgi:hypothetical protein
MISALKPSEHLHVYDLVRKAGLDVSDWANYKRPLLPQSNPKYCYEWAFEAPDCVVVCLWFEEMQQDGTTVFQKLNYREIAASQRRWSQTQRDRAAAMDHALQFSHNKNIPIRVIVVDGARHNDADGEGRSLVESRLLDPEPWHVAYYDKDGNCRLQRGRLTTSAEVSALEASSGPDRFARIAYNSSGWKRPTGEAGAHESGETFNTHNKFGYEDWLFRVDWMLDGWRYAFIQGLDKGRESYLGQSLNVSLYTIQPDKRRRLVATIYGLESLNNEQASEALAAFREKGWLTTMQDEVRAIGGNAEVLDSPEWAPNVLNVRYRQSEVETYIPEIFLADDEWIQNRHRYMLYKIGGGDHERIEKTHVGRRGTQAPPNSTPLFRRGTKPVYCTPEHARMQNKLLAELQAEYGTEHVCLEPDFVDVRVETENELIFFEIKSDLNPRAVIRQALGQILEYAYHPVRKGRCPDRLVIVGRSPLTDLDAAYFNRLRDEFRLPLSYRIVTI